MSSLSINEKLRTGHVKRWQIVRVAREQTIAEHMYLVAMITDHICRGMGLDVAHINIAREWAMIHDIPEVITGDIATPTKEAMRRAVPDSDPVKRIELELDIHYKIVYNRVKNKYPIIKDIVKIADVIEAINFLNHEGIGKHANEVRDGLMATVSGMLTDINKYQTESRYTNCWFGAPSKVYMEIIGI